MSRELCLGGEQCEGAEDQYQSRKAGWEKIQGEDCQEDEYDSDGSGDNRAGMVELDVKRQGADRQQQEGDVRVHEIG